MQNRVELVVKGVSKKIDQGDLRIAIMVQSAFFDGKQPNWHHEECFFKKARIQSITDLANYTKLKPNDKERIKKAIEENTGIVVEPVKGKKGKKRAANADSNNSALKDFKVEYSKSSRASCKLCEIKICKDEVRVCKIRYDTEVGMKFGGQPYWYHPKCFHEERESLGYFAGGDSLPGFNNLKKDDQAMIKSEIPPKSDGDVPVKKLKTEPKDEVDTKIEKENKKKMEKQDKLYHKYRNALSEYTKRDLHELLEKNNQAIQTGDSECVDHLADCMAFGVLEPCPDCKGQLILDNFNYKCTGDLSEYAKCRYTTTTPARKPMTVPKGFKDSTAFKKFKPKTDTRLFEAAPPPTIIIKKEESQVKKEIKVPPLKNLQFFIQIPRMAKDEKEKLKNRILKLGGLVTSKLTDTLAAVISTQSMIEKMGSKMDEIQTQDIEVVEPAFFDLVDPDTGTVANSLELIKVNNIAPWGSDPTKRIPQDVIDGKSIPKSGSMYVKSEKSGPTKIKIKGGTAVDPDSHLEDVAHVYKDEEGTKYTVVLSKTDVVEQKNSFYKLQLLEADDRKKYWLFRAWGRIGTTIGGTKVEDCKSLWDAKDKFENLYLDKTQNPWECRDNFIKISADSYCPVDVDYADNDSGPSKVEVDNKSNLPMQVQNLIVKIFDINTMKRTLLEFELDTEKMPLGKLSKKQIKAGYKVLTELLRHIEKGAASENKIIEATNRFFTTIPHNFGVNNPPLLDNVEAIKKKTEMLDNLLEIEIAYSLLSSGEEDDSVSAVDSHYQKLKAKIEPLDKESPEFKMIQDYTLNTHAATHSGYTLDIQEVFQVVREGEDKRYKPFKKLHNRRLLWHGSRLTNFAGILSQGLRIAPPEAPVTGYMFGKGIYFADMVSKSANYCCTNKLAPTGLLLLCEVALGNMKECTRAEMITKLPPGVHSTWGQGSTMPDPAQARQLDDGTLVPLGKPITTTVNTSLLYNEFIVYDVAQVNVKYLVQTKFNFKY